MIGMILVTHGKLAAEFLAATEHVVGPQEAMVAICIGPDDDMDQRRDEIMQAIRDTDSGAGVILLTDMFGGTPSNIAISLLDKGKVEVIAGINLPMLIKLTSVRSAMDIDAAAEAAADAAVKYINIASKILEG